MNVSALAKAAWEQPWNPKEGTKISARELQQYLIKMEGSDQKKRDMGCFDFYKDWCEIQFGDEIAEKAASGKTVHVRVHRDVGIAFYQITMIVNDELKRVLVDSYNGKITEVPVDKHGHFKD